MEPQGLHAVHDPGHAAQSSQATSTTRLQANLGSPTLSMDAQRMASQEVMTTFELLDGTLAYMSGSDPVELPIHKYSLSIRSMVRKRTVSREQLYRHNRQCAEG